MKRDTLRLISTTVKAVGYAAASVPPDVLPWRKKAPGCPGN
jgi:hypothetical protein